MKTNAKKQQKMNAKKAEQIGASIPPAPKAEVKPAETTAPVLPATKAKRQSHLALGRALADKGYTDEQALPLFHASFISRGCTRGDEWIAKRCVTYMGIGRKKVALAAKAKAS